MLQLNKIIFAVFRCPLAYLTFSMQSSTTKCLQKVTTKFSRKENPGKSMYEFLTCLSFSLTLCWCQNITDGERSKYDDIKQLPNYHD